MDDIEVSDLVVMDLRRRVLLELPKCSNLNCLSVLQYYNIVTRPKKMDKIC